VLVAAVALPFFAALAGLALAGHKRLMALLAMTSLAHAGLVASFWLDRPKPHEGLALALDDVGLLVLTVVSVVFLLVSLYTPGYFKGKGMKATNTYVACSLGLLGAMTMAASTLHFGVLWVAVEASTLAGAPLLAHRTTPRKLEATWKYLLLCSVGVALALLGTIFLGIGAIQTPVPPGELTVAEVMRVAPLMPGVWLRVAFVLLLVGYGVKMGLAPVNAWVPDAYSEAPSTVSALFSGAISNVAFLGIWRATYVLRAAGMGEFAGDLLTAFGLASLLVAAVFIIKQKDLKRMLAYSSVENYGLLALGLGLGGMGAYGALLHVLTHSLAKVLLFMVAGNILVVCGTRAVGELGGLLKRAPATGLLFAAGFFAVVGSPPFGLFWSELAIVRGAMTRPWVAAAMLFLMALIFIGMSTVALKVLLGETPATPGEGVKLAAEPPWTLFPPLLICVMLLVLGLWIPPALHALLLGATSY